MSDELLDAALAETKTAEEVMSLEDRAATRLTGLTIMAVRGYTRKFKPGGLETESLTPGKSKMFLKAFGPDGKPYLIQVSSYMALAVAGVLSRNDDGLDHVPRGEEEG